MSKKSTVKARKTTHIPLTKGWTTLVDTKCLEAIKQYKWHYSGGYACHSIYSPEKPYSIKLSRYLYELFIGPIPAGMFVDHINNNPLDNRLKNLQLVTRAENNRKCKLNKNSKTGFKGVSYRKSRNTFEAYIYYQNKKIYLGMFSAPEEAHKAYCKAADKYHGKFAKYS